MFEYKATILKIVDADTVDLEIDLGFTVSTKQRVRLLGLNAPERFTLEGKAAVAWLNTVIPAGTEVIVKSEKPGGGDKYGRYLATIYNALGSVNDALIASGHAVAWDGNGAKPV